MTGAACDEGSRATDKLIVAQTAVKSGRRDAENLGGLSLIPVHLLQHGENVPALDLVERVGKVASPPREADGGITTERHPPAASGSP